MRLSFRFWLVVTLAWPMVAAERVLDFSKDPVDAPPAGFRSTVAGSGKPGDWRVIQDEAPSAFAPLTTNAPVLSKKPVLAQLSRDPTDEHFPLLILEDEVFKDFSLTAKFKMVGGAVEQMAGIAFRIQDEKNYYVVRANSLGGNFRFYRVSEGLRDKPVGPEMEISKGVWHEIAVECKGNRIRTRLDGKEVMPDLTDNSFAEGKLGFWTKSDSVSYFSDVRINYTPRECLAQVIVHETLKKYPRLLGLKVFSTSAARPELHIVASDNPQDINQPGGQVERDCIAKDGIFFGKSSEHALVTMPLHDRNGETIAAVRFVLTTFKGQTEVTAIGRATPLIKSMEGQAKTLKDLTE